MQDTLVSLIWGRKGATFSTPTSLLSPGHNGWRQMRSAVQTYPESSELRRACLSPTGCPALIARVGGFKLSLELAGIKLSFLKLSTFPKNERHCLNSILVCCAWEPKSFPVLFEQLEVNILNPLFAMHSIFLIKEK